MFQRVKIHGSSRHLKHIGNSLAETYRLSVIMGKGSCGSRKRQNAKIELTSALLNILSPLASIIPHLFSIWKYV
jgi:hypothetical protein